MLYLKRQVTGENQGPNGAKVLQTPVRKNRSICRMHCVVELNLSKAEDTTRTQVQVSKRFLICKLIDYKM